MILCIGVGGCGWVQTRVRILPMGQYLSALMSEAEHERETDASVEELSISFASNADNE